MNHLFTTLGLIFLINLYGNTHENFIIKNQIANMTIDEKIGQLIMIAAASSEHQPTELLASQFINSPYNLDQNYLKNAITRWHIGGVIFLFKSTPEKQVKLTQELQDLAKIPLIIGQDSEWGLAMRLDLSPDKVIKYPKNMTLGAIQDLNLIYKLGLEIGQQCQNIGVHINFAPVIDVNNNPQNPVIKMRSFSDSPRKVSLYAQSIIKGMQESIMCCVKHFPGHGDTTTDSHLDLPIINHELPHLQEFELYPFEQAIKNKIQAIMVGHLLVPRIDGQVSTFSSEIIKILLKDKLKFNGLVFTDALGMQALTKYYTNAQIAVNALQAGADILLCPVDIQEAIEAIKKAIVDKLLTVQEIEQKVKKILKFKQTLKSKQFDPNFLTRNYAQSLQQELYDQAITIVKNELNLKFSDEFLEKSCLINLSSTPNILEQYLPTINLTNQTELCKKINKFDSCIFIINSLDENPASQNNINRYLRLEKLAKDLNKQTVLIIFDSPYCLKLFNPCAADVIIMAYENEPAMHKSSYKLLSGQIKAKGKLPISNFNG
jgi:beta-glucosidase-like glycosyl hydrolase